LWIEKILDIYFEIDDNEFKVGLPQGPLHSPLFALFYIRDCFNIIKQEYPRINCFGYVDDLRIYSEYSVEIANSILLCLKSYMEKKRISLNDSKTIIANITQHKEREANLMSKASNLGRAIRDEVIISSEGLEEMRQRLRKLINEISEIYSGEETQKNKLTERLQKFVDYRLVKLINSNDDWYKQLEKTFSGDYLKANIVAMWHILFIKAETVAMKRAFLSKLRALIFSEEAQSFSYVKFLAYKYLFKYSPSELRLSDDELMENFSRLITRNMESVYVKAILSSMHQNWIPHIPILRILTANTKDSELASLCYKNGLIDEVPSRYKRHVFQPRLIQNNEELIFESSKIIIRDPIRYLEDEDLKMIRYKLLKYDEKGNWRVQNTGMLDSLNDVSWHNDEQIKGLLKSLISWLKVQIKIEDQRVPSSVVDPDYIWLDNSGHIYLLGNPAWQLDYLFEKTPSSLWRKSFVSLFQVLFNIDLSDGINVFKKSWTSSQSPLLYHWQYRILNFLFSRKFSLSMFLQQMDKVLSDMEGNTIVAVEQIKLDLVVKHYVTDIEHRDNLILIANFVEGSWKNGSKECYFFTLHNHEHARYLVYRLHEIFERSGFSIYLNSKEAFRLFSACFLRDLGMLSEPTKHRLNDTNKKDIQHLQNEIRQILQVAAARYPGSVNLDLQQIYEVFSNVERVRENIVRVEHPNISEKELVGDYPDLPLSVAERRDIGIISAAHGWGKAEVSNITDDLHDGKHPIHLRLLSLLLRIADLSDVSKERVRREVLERNYHRMSDPSVFHWIKYLSVDKLTIEHRDLDNGVTDIIFIICHNYLPTGSILTEVLERTCGINCKKVDSNDMNDFIDRGANLGRGSYYNYFERSQCDITCAFINESYRWFYAEIIFINEYFRENVIPVSFDLRIVKTEQSQVDFNFIRNRNNVASVQEFMFRYFQR
jgi:hemerythrin